MTKDVKLFLKLIAHLYTFFVKSYLEGSYKMYTDRQIQR